MKQFLKPAIPASLFILMIFIIFTSLNIKAKEKAVTYQIVDTGQTSCFNNYDKIECPKRTDPFYGQDANYKGIKPAYKDNRNGTVTDLNTGLMWQKNPGRKMTYKEALKKIKTFSLAGYKDWRMPDIKELYSLILFSGKDFHPGSRRMPESMKPFIDKKYFKFKYGNPARGERMIDSQYISSTEYVHFTMKRDKTVFGVNFADGRIKGYPLWEHRRRADKKFYVIYVRGSRKYGKNRFLDNKDGTITDRSTRLMWMKPDSGHLKAGKEKNGKLNWTQALLWAKNIKHAGHSDWRLPNAKELQSIVDYSRSPKTTGSAAIDPVFRVSSIKDEGGEKNYPYYWTGTTHATLHQGDKAVYIAFGTSPGWMRPPWGGEYKLLDVHGAGSQRSDPKIGDPGRFPRGRGPQGDVIRIYNFVRCVRNVNRK